MNQPEWLTIVRDLFYKEISKDLQKRWPIEFDQALVLCENPEKVKASFLIHILEESLNHINAEKYPNIKTTTDVAISLWKRQDIGSEAWRLDARASDKEHAAIRAAWQISAVASTITLVAQSMGASMARQASYEAAKKAWDKEPKRSNKFNAAWCAAKKDSPSDYREMIYDRFALKLLELLSGGKMKFSTELKIRSTTEKYLEYALIALAIGTLTLVLGAVVSRVIS